MLLYTIYYGGGNNIIACTLQCTTYTLSTLSRYIFAWATLSNMKVCECVKKWSVHSDNHSEVNSFNLHVLTLKHVNNGINFYIFEQPLKSGWLSIVHILAYYYTIRIHIYIKLLKERSFFCPNSFPSCCNNTVMIRNDQTNFTTQRVVVQYVKISNFHYIFTLICLDLVEWLR